MVAKRAMCLALPSPAMPRARMPLVAAAAVAAGLALGPGGAAAQDPSPTAAPARAAGVTPDASPSVLRLNGRRRPAVTLSGELASTAPVRGVRVVLTGRSPAY